MRDDDEAPKIAGRHPYAGYEGPSGFADLGGYPVDAEDDAWLEGIRNDDAPTRPDPAPEDDQPEPGERDSESASRLLYNPLPKPKPAPVEAWYGPSPAHVDWRKASGILAGLAGAIALGLWLAWPETPPWQAQPATSPPSIVEEAEEPEEEQELEVVITPSARTLQPTPTAALPVRPSRTPASARPTPSQSVVPSPKPTVTIIKKVTVTPTVRAGGPEEPPATRPTIGPSAGCLTWSDCHDEPPEQ